jgi:hypothetical protein
MDLESCLVLFGDEPLEAGWEDLGKNIRLAQEELSSLELQNAA